MTFMVQKIMMVIIPCLTLATVTLMTTLSLATIDKQMIVLAQLNSNNNTSLEGINLQPQNLTNKTTEITIVEGASTLQNKAFSPESTNVKLGQNVTWTNGDSQFHTVTFGKDPDDPNVANEFDSKALSPGEKFSHVFNNMSLAGTDLTYFCQIHPAMTGIINIVQT